jgi:PPK2 family polyphosphate:nucleotide phosphotransferase
MKASLDEQFRIADGGRFRLADHDPASSGGLDFDKAEGKKLLAKGVELLGALQEKLYAEGRWALLAIFQAPDAAGKDGAIKHVLTGVNPHGCHVVSFKAPSATELDHDYLWRTTRELPERGRIGIFNRSYYEEVLVVRVHPEILARQRLPAALVGKSIWRDRFEDINAFERHLARNGTAVVKFFLNVSKEEQRRRLLARLDDPSKQWKFSAEDVKRREHWDAYRDAAEDMIRHTSTPQAPWYVVPADKKWFTRLVVASALVGALERLDPRFPELNAAARAAVEDARRVLTSDAAEAASPGKDRRKRKQPASEDRQRR